MTKEECIALLNRYSEYNGMGIPNLAGCREAMRTAAELLQQEKPKGNLEYWLEHFGMPKENIDNCITQIAQGYGACRYLEGIQHGAEAVNELAKQEQPEVDLEEYLSAKLFFLGADLIRHKPYSFNRGLNVGMTKAYDDILKKINVKKEK